MPDLSRLAFALLCVLCALAIATVAFLEVVRARRGDSLLAPWHFRLRLMSALIWVIVLLSFAGAVTIWWPPPNPNMEQRLRLFRVFVGATSLLTIALVLMIGDFWLAVRSRRRIEKAQAVRFGQELRSLAAAETARARATQRAQDNGKASHDPSDSSHE